MVSRDHQVFSGKLQQKNQRMASGMLFYRMLQDWYSFVLCDGRFTQFQVFRNSFVGFVDICSDTMCC